ncbi:MAG: hypothetical protein Q9175_007913 [Cornicularia normoerica]
MSVGEALLALARTENQHLWWTKEEVRRWSLSAQKQAGYVLDNPYIGHCDEKNPIDVERGSEMTGTSTYKSMNGSG